MYRPQCKHSIKIDLGSFTMDESRVVLKSGWEVMAYQRCYFLHYRRRLRETTLEKQRLSIIPYDFEFDVAVFEDENACGY